MDCLWHFSWDWCSRPSCQTAFPESFSWTLYTRNKEVAMEWKPYGSFLATAPWAKAVRFCQELFRIWYLIQQSHSDGRVDLGKASSSSTAMSWHKSSFWRHSQYKKGGRGGWLGRQLKGLQGWGSPEESTVTALGFWEYILPHQSMHCHFFLTAVRFFPWIVTLTNHTPGIHSHLFCFSCWFCNAYSIAKRLLAGVNYDGT